MWWQDGTAQGSSALMPWDELHMTLLSSFVPELSPASAGFFLWGRAGKRPEAAQQARVLSDPGLLGASETDAMAGKGSETFSAGLPASSRVSGVERKRSLQSTVVRHGRGVRLALLTARSEARPRDVVLGQPAVFAGLTDPGFLADGLSHAFRRSEPLSMPEPGRRPGREAKPPLPRDGELRSDGVAASNFKSLGILVWHDSLPKFFLVSRPSQPPCDTRHEEAPAAFAGASN